MSKLTKEQLKRHRSDPVVLRTEDLLDTIDALESEQSARIEEAISERLKPMKCGHPEILRTMGPALHYKEIDVLDVEASTHCWLCVELTASTERVKRLEEALRKLVNACIKADHYEELSGFIDGSLIDSALVALACPGQLADRTGYGVSKSQDKRLELQGKPKPAGTQEKS